MTSADLPAELKAALARKAEGVSRLDAARRSALISDTYRRGGGSGTIAGAADALAYALARMPATYAAVSASLHALAAQRTDFAPRSLLDIGAGPGTATFAATRHFASLDSFTLLDANPALRALALDLVADNPALAGLHYEQGDAAALAAKAAVADLVIASYMVGEIGDEARARLVDLAWARTRDVLVVIEPGTPAGYARIIALRARLIAQGGHVVAPCPHDAACPLTAPDWCHFSQRLPRSRAHMQIKGAQLPFEDERFIYVALARSAPGPRRARVLSQPAVTKVAVTTKLCTPDGLAISTTPRRHKKAYAAARKWDWGDAIPDASPD